ncbi:MAG TPA: ABC transporter ATP-binding protein [Pirellulaceae bacterium]|jgi:lipoprotein-releasing system ATP-binding protein|nr:ABC transporter ATP-binding protein [Pirellulaceae bacterium]
MPQLVIEKLSKEYPTPAETLKVLEDVNLRIDGSESLSIVGPSGSGKSTLLNILGGLDTPTGGTVRLGEIEPFSLKERELARYRNEHVGFVFQEHYLLPQLTALENVLVPALAWKGASKDLTQRAKDLLARVGLGDRTTHIPAELSGGERQRVAVARAMLLRPELLLADEPTGSLDFANAKAVTELLIEMRRSENAILIVVTHSEELASLADRKFEIAGKSLRPRS